SSLAFRSWSRLPPKATLFPYTTLFRSHFDAGQLKRLAVHRALDGNVVAGMLRYFVLRVDDIHLLVGVVHKHVLGAMFLDALGRAVAGLFVRTFRSALAVGNPAGPGTVCRH